MLLRVQDLVKHFPVYGGLLNREQARVHAVNRVNLQIQRGEIVGIVGESGCGKSTLGKTIVRLMEVTAGSVYYGGTDITRLSHAELMPFRRRMQMIFQDPYSSLNPRRTVRKTLLEVVRFHRVVELRRQEKYVEDLLEKVRLRPEDKVKFPHEFSGGMRQRIGIARALAVQPEFIVADEPVSALDVSIQAQILNLLTDLKEDLSLTIMFISHDLKVVEYFCDRIVVMYMGQIVEEVPSDALRQSAMHPYTCALLAANPPDDPAHRQAVEVLEGEVPSPFEAPAGCPFVGRCDRREERCRTDMPDLEEKSAGHRVACWNPVPHTERAHEQT